MTSPRSADGDQFRATSLLSRDAKLILSWVLVNSIPIGYMNVVPLVYLLEVGYNPSTIGAIYALGAVANTVAYIPFGLLADRYGRKVFLIVGGFIPFISYAIFAFTLNSYWLIFASILGGIGLAGGLGVAMNSPALLSLLAATTTDKNRTTVFGILQGSWILALTIGALLSFLPSLLISNFSLSSHDAHSYSYLAMSIIVAISTIPVLFIKESKSRPNVPASVPSAEISPPKLRRSASWWKLPISSGKRVLGFSIIFSFSGFGLGVIVQLIPTWFNLRFGTNETTAGLWIAVAEFCGLIAIPIIPRLVKRRGTVTASAITSLFSCLFLAFMPLAGFFEAAAVLFVLRGILITISWPIQQSYMMGIVMEKERATAVGITYTAWGVTTSIATYLGGYLLGSGLLWLPFLLGTAGYIGSSLFLWIFFRKIKPPEELEMDLSSGEIKTV
ncbi:MAG: MFS transporter [Thaumarchaeota archaeon]|nr:MFS transporter [Nitrososphaerota archaeon]